MRARVVVRLGVVALAAMTMTAACGGDGGDDEDRGAAAEPPPTTGTVPPPVTPPQVPPSRCQPAAEDDLDDIALSMTIFDSHLEQAVTATVGDYRYVAGNLVDDGAVVPGPSVWAFDGEVLYAVSPNAAEFSSFFPNRDPLVDADTATVDALLACVAP
jgi:hypothetical protein